MSPPVMVTGAAGFIGSHVVERLLRDGRRVVGIDNFSDFYPHAVKQRNVAAALSHKAFSLLELDIRDAEGIDAAFVEHRPDGVIHLAAMAGVRPSIERPALYTAVNVGGTLNLLESAVRHGVRRFLFASSSSVYGNNKKVPFAEDDPVDEPISPYAATKRSGELLCHTYSHLHGVPIACLRFFTVIGPRQRPDLAIAKFLRLIDEGRPIPVFGDGSTSRDYTYVDDIVQGVMAAFERCDRYRIINLGNHSPVTLNDLVATVEQVVGKSAKIERLPAQPGDVERTFADIERAAAELGFRPTTTLSEGVRRQWDWMRQAR